VPRDITARGQALLRVTTVSIIAIGLTILLALTLMLQHTVIGPIERLAKDASEIGHSDDLTKTLSLQTGDEIGTLAEEFNGVVRKLARARTELLDASRRAGIAEVASGVLHNVGNVLTGANVAAATVTDDVKRSKVAGLTKATELLEEHRDNLAEFITSDERGKHLPGYLIKLAEHLDEEQKGILGELDVLSRSIEHVAQIIQTQQAFANPAGVPEAASPTDLAAAALAMVEVALARHHVKVTQNFGEVAPVKLDRAKTLQILVNLLTNAAEALESVERDKRHLSLGVRSDPPSRIVFEVTDSGPGIPQEDLTKIFQEGFTTKSDGQGYGLHYGACTAKEMGGSLTAASDGPGRGSTFTLVLPVEQVTETIKA